MKKSQPSLEQALKMLDLQFTNTVNSLLWEVSYSFKDVIIERIKSNKNACAHVVLHIENSLRSVEEIYN